MHQPTCRPRYQPLCWQASVTCQQSVGDPSAKYWLTIDQLSTEQALRGTLATRQKKEGELATASLEFDFHLKFPCGSLLTELPDFSQSVPSGNKLKCKHWKTRAKGNDIITNVISPNQHFSSTFSIQIFKFQRCSRKLSHPATRAPQRAWSKASSGQLSPNILVETQPTLDWYSTDSWSSIEQLSTKIVADMSIDSQLRY